MFTWILRFAKAGTGDQVKIRPTNKGQKFPWLIPLINHRKAFESFVRMQFCYDIRQNVANRKLFQPDTVLGGISQRCPLIQVDFFKINTSKRNILEKNMIGINIENSDEKRSLSLALFINWHQTTAFSFNPRKSRGSFLELAEGDYVILVIVLLTTC